MRRHILTAKPATKPEVERDPDLALLTLDDLARHLQLSPRTVRRHVQTGHLPPPIRIGCRLRWRLAEVQFWIAQQRAAM